SLGLDRKKSQEQVMSVQSMKRSHSWTVGANALDEWGHWTHKGEYDAQCQIVACVHDHARWLNQADGRYYCSTCAHAINDACRRNGESTMCVLLAENDA